MMFERMSKRNSNKLFLKQKAEEFGAYLREQEYAPGSIGKYLRDLRIFLDWLGEREFTKENLLLWKESLRETRAIATVNGKTAAVNRFCKYMQRTDLCMKMLRVQRTTYRKESRSLAVEEYRQTLLWHAKNFQEMLGYRPDRARIRKEYWDRALAIYDTIPQSVDERSQLSATGYANIGIPFSDDPEDKPIESDHTIAFL